MTYYIKTHTVRETQSGSRCVGFRWFESFGRETHHAHSWGCRENRGTGMVWLRRGETLDAAMARRRAGYSE